ncbi:Sec7-domain-containing protein [Yamadazyma tenuis ATCC 10573]|uniref:Sec7-domain-containing protein n=1 Tax=Candida tenuis (strain ATCC 10573 / BCRC 21748 / CBS 615 / JCM 9827 / NBRC 10315 / NRRL Y-1498 / VKM Y-70) TaxID=590646 RepID=G3BEN4_CANTC|nr:uncharacterized protein CANTEDRAFT_126572 [Yamadazyma tenuis ATCC 10573]XP_006689149.1 Sec7-domain-containing protein [Yamadazyma tenuis ATCC 10573]EGV59934.1 hypothetical protein CANTEDRAFT_126572 [Yamadazyma tenuis ATCC 10573]EGV59935.1 Sec7-domain-containing protein [Yamadazyma tenuis ATCC 10573]
MPTPETTSEAITPIIEEPDQANSIHSSEVPPSSRDNVSHTRQTSTTSVFSAAATLENSNIFKRPFESILESKEAKKNEALRQAVQKGLDSINDSNSRDPHLVFGALKTVCESSHPHLKSIAIDLFAKLFDYSQFEDEDDKIKLTNDSVEVIASCFDGEGTDLEVELQVVRALLQSIVSMPCHGASLLKAVRQIYNVFIFSLNPRNQSVAQGILTQVIGTVFQRVVDAGLTKKGASDSVLNIKTPANFSNEDVGTVSEDASEQRLTLENLERLTNENIDLDTATNGHSHEDVVVKDAFLIFRAMCRLSVKDVETETLDMRSHSVRSKLLSLNIIHTILKQYIDIFLSRDVVLPSSSTEGQTRLINAVRQYLCLSLSRNSASPIAPVFELSLEIFWLIISNLRSEFKREIPVFFDEIYFPVSEMKTSTPHQKRYLLSIIERLCNDSRCIIEFYLNYDCDTNMPNICEKVIDYLTKLSLARVEVTQQQMIAFRENRGKGVSLYDPSKISNLISTTMQSRPPASEIYTHFPLEYALKMTSINCSVAFLRSLYTWAQKGFNSSTPNGKTFRNISLSHLSLNRHRSSTATSETPSNESDDPTQFESLKQRKKALLEGIKQFNQKAKKGVQYFLANGFIESKEPQDVARFLLETDGLDKAVIGEYLGEGTDDCIATMHSFVDLMDFANMSFVDAMRTFLQAFRLPGEAQKIDRFMLKFAERYVSGNSGILANAESAYVLSYSVILLNTDLHSPQIKKRMTLESFIANNAGIDDGKDIPKDYLEVIYNEIAHNEIKLQSEQHAALLAGDLQLPQTQSGGLFGGRDLDREAYFYASKEMSTKTEKLVRDLGKKTRDDSQGGVFYQATSVYHVKSIFDTLWMSILAGLTPPFKEYDEVDVTKICLEGIKLSIKIGCMFDLDYGMKSFIGALVQFENLNNYEEMKPKNVDAIHILLEIAISEGNYLKSSWIQVLTSISQLERLQLISRGIDQETIPDVSTAKLVNRASFETNNHRQSGGFFRSFSSSSTASQTASNKYHNQKLHPEVAELLLSSELSATTDKVFSNSASLNGESIVEFIKALSEVALEEIESSGQSVNPRMFSLSKMVDICYYNMTRIRVEWSQLWSAMGTVFNQVGCHSNINVAVFAIDSLRQLSNRFFELEELSHFKFQKEFLSPFEYIVHHNDSLEIKDMVLECLNNMILTKSANIKSGWKAIFTVLTVTAAENKESLVNRTYKLADWIYKNYLNEVRNQDAFGDLINCFTELCKNGRYQRVNLLSLGVLQKINNQIAVEYLNKPVEHRDEMLLKLWFPVLFGFHKVIMHGEELEVRSRALTYLFDILLEYGENFDSSFWDSVCKELLFPIFEVLHNRWGLSNFDDTNDNFSVWLSTTLIQALRNMIGLFTHYFESLRSRTSDFLSLLISCVCQENDTIARIGRSCLHTLLIENAEKFNDDEWKLIIDCFRTLFQLTEARELFDLDPLKTEEVSLEVEEDPNVSEVVGGDTSQFSKHQEKSSIVVKCVLQLLMIESLSELFENDVFYEAVPYEYLKDLADLLNESFKFSKNFNDDYDLRVRLWNAGIIERLPNLLKQESSSSAVFINIMFRMYCDDDKTNTESKEYIIDTIVPLCTDIIQQYSEFDETNQQRNLSTWKPVIIEIFQGFYELDESDFRKHVPVMYESTLKLFSRTLSAELRGSIKTFFTRVGELFIKET